MSKTKVIWTMKEFTTTLRKRQLNKFDCNLGVSGKRGDGKSTFLFKIFNSFKKDGFVAEKHQEYRQDKIIGLLASQQFGFCWDDEAINSGYKRDFQSAGQKTLIKVITNYRDNYNIYASALPFFYSLDKDLRELIFCHVHIIERGVAVILFPLRDQIHAADPWDTKNNIKIESKEQTRMKKNPDARFRYHRLTTFAGYIYFGAMTPKQERQYKAIKSEKRSKAFAKSIEGSEETFREKAYKLLKEGKLSADGLVQACLLEGLKYSSVTADFNRKLKDEGLDERVKDFLKKINSKVVNNKFKGAIDELVPDLSS